MIQEETVTREDFEFYLENILVSLKFFFILCILFISFIFSLKVPCMNPFPASCSVLVMDNAQIHHNGRVADIVESAGCLLLYLPAYSPDLNPIEKAFSVFKSSLRHNNDLLNGGEDDFFVIDQFVGLVFTSCLIQKLFAGCGYGL